MRSLLNYLAYFATLYFVVVRSLNDDVTYSTSTSQLPGNYYEFFPIGSKLEKLLRRKRETNSAVLFHQEDEESTEDGLKLPNETVWWTNASHLQIDYRYYELNLYTPAEKNQQFSKYWIDIPALLQTNNKTMKGELRHKQLANSYRRAVSQKLTFKFPFYGHETENVTIATGGFVYAGDHVHSWLAATQYIAPLMANFDTTSSEDSNILYADNGEFFVVEWNQVVLRHQAEAGNFTFQVSLHKNGDIWFVYKNIPIEVKYVSDLHHPRKVGLSDAYLFTHTILTLSRRVIYEYHRVEVNLDFIKSGSVVVLKAQPVCIMLKDCRSCVSSNLTAFNCTWCEMEDDGGVDGGGADAAAAARSFCSDQDGFNRRRQDYLDNQCNKQSDHLYCSSDDDFDKDKFVSGFESTTSTSPTSSSSLITTAVATPVNSTNAASSVTSSRAPLVDGEEMPTIGLQRPGDVSMKSVDQSGMSAGSIFVLIFLLASLLSVAAWFVYAYTNPQTPSGQFLIRNRPSRWRWPSNHGDVRYTAPSVHM